MEKKYNKSLFLFHRDLRLDDNTGLMQALEHSEKVILCFIFDPEQISKKNDYKSDNAVQFMIESLDDLQNQLKKKKAKLYIFSGDTPKVIKKLIKQEKLEALFSNRDYTPFARKRDKALANLCKKTKIDCNIFDDALLHEPEACLKKNKEPYTVFTPFFKNASKLALTKPIQNRYTNYFTGRIAGAESSPLKKYLPQENNKIFARGGRSSCKKLLAKLKNYKSYKTERDFPSLEKTTGLSAHNKFGTCSIREIFMAIEKALGRNSPLLRQLFWRDFFTHIAYHFPKVFGQAFNEKYRAIKWSSSKKNFQAWCEGKTGFPIVDAGMRQLNQTGYMHNRVRMIVASFLTKDLHIDWRWGEKYFAQKLVDYDPCVNNGSWQWAASTGCDAQPYFRIFNPWLQQKKFDKECAYIKKWLPELKNLESKVLHSWYKTFENFDVDYPGPIVEHGAARAQALKMFKDK